MRHTYTWVGVSFDSGVALNRPATLVQFVEVCDHILTGRKHAFLICIFLHPPLSTFSSSFYSNLFSTFNNIFVLIWSQILRPFLEHKCAQEDFFKKPVYTFSIC